ncbi:carbon-nitrogen hydrolase family protein [Delftia tsuruhatensis]|uniref:carbon-nitrogen hydrolase family protein n=1 Tax=Delftia tsuruhatensis TaxID=180282 RepID=UPI001F166089|nr:carbon-nitrogen hydrolase family protein [Delftia tsuruhatensis]
MTPSCPPRFTAAAVQAAPVFLDSDATIRRSLDLIAQAAARGAQLVVFPELWCPGYPWWVWLGSPAWGSRFAQRYADQSLERDGPQLRAIAAAAARHRMHVSFSFSERQGGSLYISQALFGDDGRLLHCRRKLKPARTERGTFGQGSGSDLRAVDTALGRFGQLCCGEHYQVLFKAGLMAQGEEVHVAAWPSFSLLRGSAFRTGPEAAQLASRSYALEGQCHVIMATSVADTDMLETVCDTPERLRMMSPVGMARSGGSSMIYSPDGEMLCEALPEGEVGLVLAEIDRGRIASAKIAVDAFGHWARPDIVQLRLCLSDAAGLPACEPFGEAAP